MTRACYNKFYMNFRKPVAEYTHWRRIINEVAQKQDVDPSEILARNRARPVVMARRECCKRMRAEIKIAGRPASFPMIGKWLGGLDHTTIIHHVYAK